MKSRDAVVKQIGIAAVYLLTLLTQLPHIGQVYSTLERGEYQHYTAWGAAVAFEASVALFTLRLLLNKASERSKWTAWGVRFFLVLSGVVNMAYYFAGGFYSSLIQNYIALLLSWALPLALWLFAEEFGASVKAETRRAEKERGASVESPQSPMGEAETPIVVTETKPNSRMREPEVTGPWDRLPSNVQQLLRVVYERLGSEPFTRQQFETLAGVARATASAHLKAGQAAGIIVRHDAGRIPRYQVGVQPPNGKEV